MIKSVAHVVVALSVVVPAIAFADEPVTTEHAGTVVVVTPQAPVVITGQGQGQAQAAQEQDIEPPAMAPVMPAEPPVAASPQNQPWTNVSHINGTVVPVGEQNRYLYDFKKTTISTNPIGWIFGFWGVSVSHALSNNIAIRVDANMMSFADETGYEVGVSLPIYFRRTFSGPFIEPGIIARGFSNDSMDYADCLDCSSSSSRFVGPEMLFGWQWMFDSGWNVAMAFGAARSMERNSVDSGDQIEPAGYFRIGYGF